MNAVLVPAAAPDDELACAIDAVNDGATDAHAIWADGFVLVYRAGPDGREYLAEEIEDDDPGLLGRLWHYESGEPFELSEPAG